MSVIDISELSQPYRALAELRKNQFKIHGCGCFSVPECGFFWDYTREGGVFWQDVFHGKTPKIPMKTIEELSEIGLLESEKPKKIYYVEWSERPQDKKDFSRTEDAYLHAEHFITQINAGAVYIYELRAKFTKEIKKETF